MQLDKPQRSGERIIRNRRFRVRCGDDPKCHRPAVHVLKSVVVVQRHNGLPADFGCQIGEVLELRLDRRLVQREDVDQRTPQLIDGALQRTALDPMSTSVEVLVNVRAPRLNERGDVVGFIAKSCVALVSGHFQDIQELHHPKETLRIDRFVVPEHEPSKIGVDRIEPCQQQSCSRVFVGKPAPTDAPAPSSTRVSGSASVTGASSFTRSS